MAASSYIQVSRPVVVFYRQICFCIEFSTSIISCLQATSCLTHSEQLVVVWRQLAAYQTNNLLGTWLFPRQHRVLLPSDPPNIAMIDLNNIVCLRASLSSHQETQRKLPCSVSTILKACVSNNILTIGDCEVARIWSTQSVRTLVQLPPYPRSHAIPISGFFFAVSHQTPVDADITRETLDRGARCDPSRVHTRQNS